MTKAICLVNEKEYPAEELVDYDAVRPQMRILIKKDHPEFSTQHFISHEEVGSSHPATRGLVDLHCITGSGLQLIGGDVKAPKEQRL